MEIGDKPRSLRAKRGGGGVNLCVCFTSRRKLKRLRKNASTKGGGRQSPTTFSSTTAEPSSPKVTCIGQVRVKTSRRRRKKAAAVASVTAMRSRSRSGSFRRSEERSRHQSWVHLPLGVLCDALRGFGSEVDCCFRMRRPCCVGRRKRRRWRWRWWRNKEVMVVEEPEPEPERRRRSELELVADELQRGLASQGSKNVGIKNDAEGEVPASCVPPKNALLLMRYRSDPARVSALQSRFRAEVEQEDDDGDEQEGEVADEMARDDGKEKERGEKVRFWQEGLMKDVDLRGGSTTESIDVMEDGVNREDGDGDAGGKEREDREEIEAVAMDGMEEVEAMAMEGKEAEDEKKRKKMKSVAVEEARKGSAGRDGGRRRRSLSTEKEMRRSTSYREGRRSSFSSEGEARRSSFATEKEGKRRWSFSSEKESKAMAPTVKKDKDELPDCLLLMMYEPKLSMEISRETWVCTADFLRWQPQRRRQQHGGGQRAKVGSELEAAAAEENKALAGVGESKEAVTASVPESPTRANARNDREREDRPVKAAVPFALTRCKSEPTRLMSSSSGKFSASSSSSDGCIWKSMPRLIGVAGIGF